MKDIDAVFNIGLVAPAGTPAAIVEKNRRRRAPHPDGPRVPQDQRGRLLLRGRGFHPAEYKAFLARDLKVQGERVKTSGATLD